ncbi:MAG TPA: hypothetical protein DCS88_10475, partial [Alphaproteobacteria bacterium]|nr:hypothetical protein [Alphaproteobacteria bacterium]
MSDNHTVGIVIRADGSSLVAEVEKSKKSLVDLTESTQKVGAETGKATSEIGRLDDSMSRAADSSSRA